MNISLTKQTNLIWYIPICLQLFQLRMHYISQEASLPSISMSYVKKMKFTTRGSKDTGNIQRAIREWN